MRHLGIALCVAALFALLISPAANLSAQTTQCKPQLQAASRRIARSRSRLVRYNEAGAINSLRTLFSAEATFQATAGNGSYGTLEELNREKLVDYVLAEGHRYGYLFKIRLERFSSESPASLEIVAIPRTYGRTGKRSFYINEAGVIHAADKKGAEASIADEPLDQ
jgi:hypothetical protein